MNRSEIIAALRDQPEVAVLVIGGGISARTDDHERRAGRASLRRRHEPGHPGRDRNDSQSGDWADPHDRHRRDRQVFHRNSSPGLLPYISHRPGVRGRTEFI